MELFAKFPIEVVQLPEIRSIAEFLCGVRSVVAVLAVCGSVCLPLTLECLVQSLICERATKSSN